MRRRSIVALLIALLSARSARAQQVRGVVTDSATAAPIAGAVASLLDPAGRALARTISDQQGRFRLPLTGAATRIQLLRIGYRPRDVRLPPAANGDIAIALRMDPVPKFLESVRVSDKAMCPGAESGTEALTLWEQVRAGLLATVVAREARPAGVRNLVYERRLDVRTGKVLSQVVHKHSGVSTRPFVASRSAEAFALSGYVVEDGGARNYFSPDADVLLDPTFMATHCFRVQFDSVEHAGQVGIGFQPVPGRDTIVDVSGVLWVDRDVPALRTFDFRYTGLEPAGMAARAGGNLVFRAMPNGVVFIERWKILMPMYTQLRTGMYSPPVTRRRSDRTNLEVTRLLESGGELAFAVWPDARWEASLGKVAGQVVERGTGRPLPNVRVWLENTDEVVTTDSSGIFVMADLLPGPYALKAADTTLAEFGFSQSREMTIEVSRQTPVAATITMDALDDQLQKLCRGQLNPPLSAPVLGRVYLPDGAPARNGGVDAKWQDILMVREGEFASFRDVERKVDVDGDGRFQLCGVPVNRPIRLRATSGGALAKDSTFRLGRDATYGLITMRVQPVPPRP